jgi:acetyl-CoA carboxylase biotin carboxylase subunit
MRRVLIANRGEIAVRIARACRALGLSPVGVFSEADRHAVHPRVLDAAVCVGPAPARESYLRIDAILDAAKALGADAVHPGYGFLAENAAFAQAVEDAGLTWIGPSPASIATMGDKLVARATAGKAGVPLVPGADVDPADVPAVTEAARRLGFPILVKAAAGGGGKGMRTVASEAELPDALAAAAREATSAFGDGRVYLEKLLVRPRHVEVQVLADRHGTLVHLGERECSIQRRHQKIVEESPCPVMTPDLRRRMTDAALAAARAVDYVGAGTVEFLLGEDGTFAFLEMNTRLQVEHPVTEWVTGIDLVVAQLKIAMGEPLGFAQDDVALRGHAIEVRLYAEDAARGFLPSAGPLLAWQEPAGPWVRTDAALGAGSVVPVEYDPMLAKLSAWGPDRATATARLRDALRDTVALGPTTNQAFLRDVLAHPAWAAGATHTGFVDEHLAGWKPDDGGLVAAAIAAAASLRRPVAAPAAVGAASVPTPWDTLGAWRLR